MKRWPIFALAAVFLLVTACANNNEAGNSSVPGAPAETAPASGDSSPAVKTSKDGMGHEVTVPANPKSVLASYLEDHLAVLGVKPVAQWSVANGIQDYLQEHLQGIPTINYDLPPETVAGFNPDLIIVGSTSQVQNGLYEQYSKIAPTYVLGDEINKDWRKSLLKIGELLNKSDEANKAIADYNKKASEAKAKIQQTIGTKSAAILWMTQKQFYMVDDKVASGAVVYGDLGVNPPNLVTGLPAEAKANWNPVTLEKLTELDADYIFLINGDKGQGAETLNSPIWKSVPAVKAGHVYEMDTKSSWLYSGAIAGSRVIDDVVKTLGIK